MLGAMNNGRFVFAQLLDFLPLHEFRKCVERYDGNRRIRSFSCWDQFLCMTFGQLAGCHSLREVTTCLRAKGSRLYHVGIRGQISRSTLADANETRDWRIYADFAALLIVQARRLYSDQRPLPGFDQIAYAFDSTTIDLCLKLFPWAKFRRRKSAVKLHTLLDIRGDIPCFVHITGGNVADVKALDVLLLEAGAFYILDRGYVDFTRLYRFTTHFAYFVTRAKRGMRYRTKEVRPVDAGTGVRSDKIIRLCGVNTSHYYPSRLRRIVYFDPELNRRFVFLSNHLELPAITICELYRRRWRVELFFKWIKQNLRVKAFYGYSPNAVKTQIWIAVGVYALVLILRKELGIRRRSPSDLLQILGVSLFEKEPLLLDYFEDSLEIGKQPDYNQLSLFNL